LFEHLINSYAEDKEVTETELVSVIAPQSISKVLAVTQSGAGRGFSDETKSAIFIRDSLKNGIRCPICGGYVDVQKSVSYDHIERVRDGGTGLIENGQLTHPYCNTAIKS
jgi:HNH endonuclease